MNWKQCVSLGLCSVGAYEVQDEQWETLFEGDLTTASKGEGLFPCADFLRNGDSYFPFEDGKTYRLTVDGTSAVFVSEPMLTGYGIGNKFLCNSTALDSGYDFAAQNEVFFDKENPSGACFRSRTPGTYTVKIERKL